MINDDDRLPDTVEHEDPLSVEALEWFVRLRDEALDQSVSMQFSSWLDQSPRHREAYAEIESLWSDLDAVAPSSSEPQVQRPQLEHNQMRWRSRGGWALAASVALLVAFNAPQLWDVAAADVSTGAGETRTLTLADGTQVALAGDSAIEISINSDQRRIRLLKGRAWFNVVHEARPFTVAFSNAQVRDIGTAFEMIERESGGEVIVSDGAIELTVSGGRALRLHKDQAARFEQDHRELVGSVPGAATWRVGRLQFVDEPVSDVLDDLERFGAPRAIVLNRDLGHRRMTGVIDLADPIAAQEAILDRAGARGRRLGPWLFVTQQ